MPSFKREGHLVVIKRFAVSIHAIVASQTLASKRCQVIGHVSGLALLMAICAYPQIHCVNLVPVAVQAGESRPAGGRLVPFQ